MAPAHFVAEGAHRFHCEGDNQQHAHWQMWMATAVLVHAASCMLNRYGRRGVFEMPQGFGPAHPAVTTLLVPAPRSLGIAACG